MLEINQNLQQNMDILKKIKNYTYNERHCLGQGSFGKVFEGKAQDGHQVAIKKIQKSVISNDNYLRSALQTEITIMKKLNHPNIVYLQDVVMTNNSIYLVMQYCSGGDLKRYCRMKKITEQMAIEIIKQIAQGFQQISRHGIIHRDLKPANILVHENIFKICDFGFAKFFVQTRMAKTCVGTPIYMSPQVLSKKHYTDKTDIWSLGIMFYQLVFGKIPYKASSEQELIKAIMSVPISISACSTFSQKLIIGTLQVHQQNRWNWKQVFELFSLQPIMDRRMSKTTTNGYRKQTSLQQIPQKNKSKQQQMKTHSKQRIPSKEDISQIPQLKRPQSHKLKPRNLLAYHQIENNQIKNQTYENPRFMYFLIVQLLTNPIDLISYHEFLVSLYKQTVTCYEKYLQQLKEKHQDLEHKVIMSELNEIMSLSLQIPKLKVQHQPRRLAVNFINQLSNISNTKNLIGWIDRFIRRQYKYTPFT